VTPDKLELTGSKVIRRAKKAETKPKPGHFHFRKQARLYYKCPPTAPGGDWIYL
jgi:hypothetical protein